MPWSRTAIATRSPSTRGADLDRLPGSEYLTALSSRFVSALTHLAAVARRSATSGDVGRDAQRDAGARRPRPARRRPPRRRARRPASARGRRLLGLDQAEVEQVVDDPREPVGLAHDPLGELARRPPGRRSAAMRLGEQPERADRRLQLVAHVGDEVAAHALDRGASRRRRATNAAAPTIARRRASGTRRQLQHLARRAEELQLALARARPPRASVEQLVERAGGDRVGVPRRRGTARPPRCGTPRRRRRRRRRRRGGSSSSTASEPVALLDDRRSVVARAPRPAPARARRPSAVRAAAGSWQLSRTAR